MTLTFTPRLSPAQLAATIRRVDADGCFHHAFDYRQFCVELDARCRRVLAAEGGPAARLGINPIVTLANSYLI
jgi:hypothetical protein